MVVETQDGAERENRTDNDLHLLWKVIQNFRLRTPEVLQPGMLSEDEVGRRVDMGLFSANFINYVKKPQVYTERIDNVRHLE